MATRTDESLLFVAEWYDPQPQMKKQYLLKYFPEQHMAEMVDVKHRKIFLKKSPCPPHTTKEDFYVGGKIVLYSRELEIVDYGDLKTKEKLHFQIQQCVVLLPPSSYSYWGKVIDDLHQDTTIVQAQTVILPPNHAHRLCSVLEENSREAQKLSDGVSLALLLHAEDGFNKIQSIADKFNANQVQMFYAKNGMQSSDLASFLLDPQNNSTATLDNCTCCIIKPHAVKARHMGGIIDEIINQGYEISAVRSMLFEKAQAEEFLEVYKGVIPEYADHVVQLCTGLSIALELRAQQAVDTFRVTAGPWDIELAKELRPNTLRAKYGVDRILNAVHCTDLPEDGPLECEYCFKLM